MANNIFLEVSKSNGAILSYYLEQPTTPSTTVDYVEATGEELIFLNALEDNFFAPGTVATLSDLTDHRARVQAAKKAKAPSPAKPAAKAAGKASNTDPMVITNFKNGFKPVRKQTQTPR
jgi:hypothetical protein